MISDIDKNIRLSWACNLAVEVLCSKYGKKRTWSDADFDIMVERFLTYFERKKIELWPPETPKTSPEPQNEPIRIVNQEAVP